MKEPEKELKEVSVGRVIVYNQKTGEALEVFGIDAAEMCSQKDKLYAMHAPPKKEEAKPAKKAKKKLAENGEGTEAGDEGEDEDEAEEEIEPLPDFEKMQRKAMKAWAQEHYGERWTLKAHAIMVHDCREIVKERGWPPGQ